MKEILKFAGINIAISAVIGAIAGQFGWVATLDGYEMPLLDVTGGIIFIVLGLIVYAIGAFMPKKVEPVEQVKVVAPPPNLDFIYDVLRKNRNMMLGSFIFCSSFGCILIGIVLSMPRERDSIIPMVVMGVLGVTLLIVSGRSYLIYSKMKDIRKSEPYDILMNRPETITELTATFIKSGKAPGKMGQRISLTIMQGKKKVTAILVSETNLGYLQQHVLAKNPNVKIEKKTQEV